LNGRDEFTKTAWSKSPERVPEPMRHICAPSVRSVVTATLVATVLDTATILIDETLEMHERFLGKLFNKAQRKHLDSFQEQGKAINDKVRLYALVGQALIEAKQSATDPFSEIEKLMTWEAFKSSVVEAAKLARPEEFDYLALVTQSYTSGSCEVAKNYPNFPAWTCKVVGGTTVHWAGCSLRFQEHEFRTKDVYGDIPGANLLNWPLTLAELEPYYDTQSSQARYTPSVKRIWQFC
jgi:hypothetical protein